MHELSIALSLVEAAEEAGRQHEGRVTVVYVSVGRLSGVVPDALQGSWEMARAATALAETRLEIEDVPAVVYCARCRAERELPSEQCLQCPECGEATPDLRRGRELELRALEIES